MVASPPHYDDLLNDALAALQGTTVTTVTGQSVPLDTEPGSFTLGVATAISLTLAVFYRRQDDVQAALTLDTAQGADLDALVALVGVERNAATQAQVPVLFVRATPTTDPVQIGINLRVMAYDASSQPTISFLTVQGAGLPPGVAAIIPANSQSAWGLAQAVEAGASGNVGTNAVAQMGTPILGVDRISNPPASTPTSPTLAVTGTPGAVTATYRVVGRGYTGTTLPSASTTLTTAPTTLSGTNYVTVSWNQGTDGGAVPALTFDVLKQVGTAWDLIGTTSSLSLTDTGQTPVPYALPVLNTSNQGAGGTDTESDTALRARAPQALAARSTSTATAITDAVQALPNVAAALCTDGTTPGTATCAVVAISYPLSPAQQTAVTQTVGTTKALGAQIAVTFVAPTLVAISYTATADSSVARPTDLAAAIQAALAAYIGTLTPGVPVRYSAVIATIMAVPGVVAVSTLALTPAGGSTYTNADVPASPGVLYGLGTITPTLGY